MKTFVMVDNVKLMDMSVNGNWKYVTVVLTLVQNKTKLLNTYIHQLITNLQGPETPAPHLNDDSACLLMLFIGSKCAEKVRKWNALSTCSGEGSPVGKGRVWKGLRPSQAFFSLDILSKNYTLYAQLEDFAKCKRKSSYHLIKCHPQAPLCHRPTTAD